MKHLAEYPLHTLVTCSACVPRILIVFRFSPSPLSCLSLSLSSFYVQIFSGCVIRDSECLCVELTAYDLSGQIRGVCFLGTIQYDSLKKFYDSKVSELYNRRRLSTVGRRTSSPLSHSYSLFTSIISSEATKGFCTYLSRNLFHPHPAPQNGLVCYLDFPFSLSRCTL
ncbi:unnamed protein product [Echinostoma caproni]|uniref:Uncharacterized protein n=1 Tax=Echinostoma caproni TaxID=27848 RepID=A0A3P8HXM3_9TREM|nr:unnamed protein product [Echinostoma caproni]